MAANKYLSYHYAANYTAGRKYAADRSEVMATGYSDIVPRPPDNGNWAHPELIKISQLGWADGVADRARYRGIL